MTEVIRARGSPRIRQSGPSMAQCCYRPERRGKRMSTRKQCSRNQWRLQIEGIGLIKKKTEAYLPPKVERKTRGENDASYKYSTIHFVPAISFSSGYLLINQSFPHNQLVNHLIQQLIVLASGAVPRFILQCVCYSNLYGCPVTAIPFSVSPLLLYDYFYIYLQRQFLRIQVAR